MKCRGNMKYDLQKNELEAKKLQQQHNAQKGSHFPDEKNNVQKQIDNLLKYTSYTMKRLQHPPARYYLGKRLFSKTQALANKLGIKFLKKRLIPGTAFFSFLIPVLFLLLGWGGQNDNNKPDPEIVETESERVVRYFGQAHPQLSKEPVDWDIDLQPSQAGAMTTNETLPAGTLIIAMDGALQDNSENRVRQAYGLAIHLLHADIPLKWIIDPNKTNRTAIDFSASARQAYPSVGSFANRNFRTGPIAIFPGFEAQAQSVINSFGNGIRVYELQNATTVPVHSDLTHKPFVFVEEDQNPDIHTGILSAAGLTEDANGAVGGITGHYQEGDLTTINVNSCVTIITVPHNDNISTAQVNAVKDFTRNGGNFFAQCAGVRGFQGLANASVRVFTNAGFVDEPGLGTFLYDNPQEPSAQFEGTIEDEGGSLEDFAFNTDPPGGTRIVHDSDNDFKAYAGRIDGFNSATGGYVHYLGGHNHDGDIDADRFYLNAVLRSATRPSGCGLTIATVNAVDDSGVVDCGTGFIDIDVLNNDMDLTNNPPLTIQNLNNTTPSLGTFTVVSGQVRFTPNYSGAWSGPAIATYEACNNNNLCDQATITVSSSAGDDIVIGGTVFEDLNSDGNLDGGEPGDGGVNVFLYEDNSPMNGVPDGPAIQTATTNGSGEYSFNINNLVFSQNFMYNQRTGASSNDAVEEVGGKGDGDVSINDNEVPIGSDDALTGLRFTGLNIPANSTINSAFMYFDIGDQGKGDSGTGGAVTIEAQNSSNPPAFTTADNNISNRTTTASSVNWTIGAWNDNTSNNISTNIATLVQEVVDNNSGCNDLAVIITNTDVDGYPAIAHDDIPSQAPRLVVDYDAPGGGPYHFIVEVDQSDLPVSSSLTTPGSYSLTASSEGTLFCDTDFGYEFICPDPPDAGSDGAITICEGAVATVNLFDIISGEDPGGGWTESTSSGVTIGAGTAIDFSNVSPGTYTFTYTVSAVNCPTDMSTATITVENALDPGTNGTIDICEGETVTTTELFNALGGSPDAGGTWSPAPAGGGTYTYTHVATANCPAASSQVVVTEQPAPDAGTNGTLTICEGETVTTAELFNSLGGSPDAGGSWSPALAGAGTYTYTVNGAPNCPNATAQVVVSEQAAPDAGTNGTLTICEGETVTTAELFNSLGGSPDAGGSWSLL